MELSGRRVVIVGLGRSGVAAASLCVRRGAIVSATDLRSRANLGETAAALDAMGVTLHLGSHDEVPWDKADLVVISPGVPPFPAIAEVERSGREVIGELELASRMISAPIALVGGTNGKSTVTSWLGAMMSHGSRKVFTGGNLGVPPAEVIEDPYDLWVLEISSFQAERIPTLHARSACLLNVTDDHLDRYESFDAYAQAKGNVFVRMTPEDVAVIPVGDELCARQASRGNATKVTFGPGGDVSVQGDWIVDRLHDMRWELASIRLSGVHNQLNACAAIGMAVGLGATQAEIAESLRTFTGLGHRTAFAGEIKGIRFYDDSKGTNVGASVAALRGLKEPRGVLIAGGRDKLGSYAPLVEALRDKGRAVVVIGEAADRIAEATAGVLPTIKASTMEDAVRKSFELAQAGDAVLLSPACASFDMFRDYGHRGVAFCEAVQKLSAEIHGGKP
ncbi:MAG: UDP-N-acetylmuramoyl-L-alanine--D-glutamate ligase [Deltaproteobacteria bacterium]|nr:UDP-N-acetylmuramoyl-L-alanine--D-glutamate ligase [Deltaproteobacteria bacterium]